MNVFEEIRQWAATRRAWQQDAVRRIVQHGALTQVDLDQVYRLLKSEHQVADESPVAPAMPLKPEDTPGPASEPETVVLTKMHDLRNVNALAPDQALLFAHQGLSVFYGQNAAGKSGYSRVLKRACRAREVKETVLPDVFAESQAADPATASFELLVNGIESSERWVSGEEPPDPLRSIAVFDSKCARLYVDDENGVVFVPYGLDVLPELATLCGKLKTEIDRDVAACLTALAPLTDADGNTAVGRLVANLDGGATVQEVERIGALDEAETEELGRLRTQLGQLKASDPAAKATSLTNQAERLGHLRALVRSLHDAVSRQQINVLKQLSTDAVTASVAATLASQEAFRDEEVRGTGSEAWKRLFKAARDFSLADAYPDEPFPFVADASRCVLCQQLLADEAKERLQRFGRFVNEATAKEAEESATALKAAVDRLAGFDFSPQEANPSLLGELKELDGQLCARVKAHLVVLQKRSEAILKATEDGIWNDIPLPLPSTASAILAAEVALREEASRLIADSRPEETARIESVVAELAGREELEKHRPMVLRYLRLRECRDQTNPRAISERQGKLMEQAVTEELRGALTSELVTLGLTHLHFDLRKKIREGVTYHQLELSGAANSPANLSQVLSEGEQCVVAIASFLAEVAVHPTMSGLVFDDPVCSLDQDWRMRIAERLAAEARNRQVVIFTHDVVFLLALNDEATLKRIPLHIQTIFRRGDSIGVCESELPWAAGSVRSRLGVLKNLATDWNRAEKEGRLDACAKIEEEFYSKLRAAWEQAVEELVFKSVIQRFRKSVQPQQLRYVTFDRDDYLAVTRAMAKCSDRTDAHDTGPGRELGSVTHAEMVADIGALETFRTELTKKQEAVEAERKTLTAPPTAMVDD